MLVNNSWVDNYHIADVIVARNYTLNRNGTPKNSFSYVCNSKKIKELFAPTLNKITARDRCVSFTTVVANAQLFDWLRRMRTKKDDGEQRNPT